MNTFVVKLRLASGDGECAPAVSDAARSETCSGTTVQQEWSAFRGELIGLLNEARAGRRREAQAHLARRVSDALPSARPRGPLQSPVEIEFDNDSHARTTVIHIAADDTSGFLYELTNALALLGIDIRHLEIQTVGSRVQDILRVTDESGRKLLDPRRQQELRVAIVLIQHFTDLLPQSPDPEAALLHFQQLLESELQEPDWLDRLTSLRRPEVLAALTKLLGVGDLFWEDFLRLQHSNLFPVLTDVAGLRQQRTRAELQADLNNELQICQSTAERRERLNAFKDREMFRVDMRHIVGVVPEFEEFARELTELAEVVIVAACSLAESQLRTKHGSLPKPCRWCAAALGKLGGSEIGFASDIELLFIHDGDGVTSGPQIIANGEYFHRLIELFQQTLQARRAGIFRVDLRLRPYGRAGNLAVSLEEFCRYFAVDGPAWPFERQSLIKLRPVAGDVEFGGEVLRRRDDLIFANHRWDSVPVRAMRERQVRQLVRAGTIHAKFSPGALVDVEYLVQLLQLTHGDRHPSLRTPNTRQALTELTRCQILPADAAEQLRTAYFFFRRLIDALRMSRGSADDLTLPADKSDELAGLAHRPHLECVPTLRKSFDTRYSTRRLSRSPHALWVKHCPPVFPPKDPTMKTKATLFVVALAAALVLPRLFADDKDKLNGAKCPVSGKPAKAESSVAYRDAKVYFCCDDCPESYNKDKAKFATKANAQLAVTGQAKQQKCPIKNTDLNKDTQIDVGGAKVAFCCNGCKGKVEKAKDDEKLEMVFADKVFEKAFKVEKAK